MVRAAGHATVVAPADLDAPRAAIVAASRPMRERGRRQIRAALGSHSWSPLVVTDDTVLALGQLDRVLASAPRSARSRWRPERTSRRATRWRVRTASR